MLEESMSSENFRKDAILTLNNMLDEFNKYQELVLDTLRAIHNVCEKNNIDYYLAYGSLLGAVRDNGQIPWDYDVDIWVEGRQIPQFIEALKRDLSDDYYYVCRFYDKSHRHFIMRVAPKGYSTEILHVDIFWLWNAGCDRKKAERRIRIIDRFRHIAFWHNCDLKYITLGMPGGIKKICRIKKIWYTIFPNWLLDKFYLHQINKHYEEGDYFIDEYKVLNRKDFNTRLKVKLNDGYGYYIPSGYESILKEEYGEYSKYPPIENRLEEIINSLQRIRAAAKLEV